ncbi:glycosyltransferase [Bifidobacterium gallicum]|uniref:Glycosyltransferase, group 1 family protein n=1 Tax=Bifidobacterium gallicum DSM 20093 = LMG 11596 TaxID=561180 RepID=D1NRU0_9BIFI|nr:glycosyltransferase [Bifidobacterium gallicum]EFA23929.1 glycosyltransferase, group 1 family protein [Bifidobacterium gallicum DSM 20093 = LMG 11596]KFI59095.1 putative capsular polysaccharide biosynthesis protein Cps4H [Bifidobacterium gallicum DSM 20093 = LMG 11596]
MPKKPSVLFLEVSNNWGGVEAFISNAALHLQDSYDVEVIARTEDRKINDRIQTSKDHVIIAPGNALSLRYLRTLWTQFRKNYDVIHFNKNSAVLFIPILLAKLASRSTIVVESHNTAPSQQGPLGKLHYLFRPLVCRLANAKLACSQVAGTYMFGQKAVDAGTVAIIPNCIDDQTFLFNKQTRADKRAELGIGADTHVIINVATLAQRKNQRFLLEVFREYLQDDPSAILLLVGDGEDREMLRQRARELGIDSHTRFLGLRKDVPQLLMAADIAVFPSLSEGFPYAFIEAQGTGLPLVVSDTVTRDIDVTGNVSFASLHEPAAQWAHMINEYLRRDPQADRKQLEQQRVEAMEKVRAHGFGGNQTAHSLDALYHRFI